jgi:hypothetical protein
VLPKLKDPPVITDNVCGNMTVTFKQWVKDLDIGDGPIGQYRYVTFKQWVKYLDIGYGGGEVTKLIGGARRGISVIIACKCYTPKCIKEDLYTREI